MTVITVGAVYMLVSRFMVMLMGAVGAMHMRFVGHYCYSGMKLPGMISPVRDRCTLRVNHEPASTWPSRR